jgi:hypothetical protein
MGALCKAPDWFPIFQKTKWYFAFKTDRYLIVIRSTVQSQGSINYPNNTQQILEKQIICQINPQCQLFSRMDANEYGIRLLFGYGITLS